MCKSIHHRGGDRASCRMRIALGENHRESGVTLKARVTWGAVNDSLCTVFSTPAIREGQATRRLDFAVENGIGRVRNPVTSSGRLGAFDFLGEVHPNRAAVQPCLDGPVWKADHRNLKAVRWIVAHCQRPGTLSCGDDPDADLKNVPTQRACRCRHAYPQARSQPNGVDADQPISSQKMLVRAGALSAGQLTLMGVHGCWISMQMLGG